MKLSCVSRLMLSLEQGLISLQRTGLHASEHWRLLCLSSCCFAVCTSSRELPMICPSVAGEGQQVQEPTGLARSPGAPHARVCGAF